MTLNEEQDPTQPGIAVVVGASGGIGNALVQAIEAQGRYSAVLGYSRSAGAPRLDLEDEDSIAACAGHCRDLGAPLHLLIDATGYLHGNGFVPEKGLRHLDAAALARQFAINAIGPALLMKHFLPLLPREGRALFATLSARVGSIGDNRLGGWHGYRASKAALNQILRTVAVELSRLRPQAICVALHPGTVDTPLSAPFAKAGLEVRSPADAARDLLAVLDGLSAQSSGGFFDHRGTVVPW